MSGSFINTLPANIRRQLQLCGITTDSQLAQGEASAICQDLQKAAKLFPEEEIQLSETDICNYIDRAKSLVNIRKNSPADISTKQQALRQEFIQSVSLNDGSASSHSRTSSRRRLKEKISAAEKHKHSGGFISAGHPFTLWLGALACILVPLFMLSLLLIPNMLLLSDFRPLGKIDELYAIIPIVLILPYILTVRLVRCSVCHMNIFTFRKYPFHSKAHRLPLLGVPIATALHVLFFFRFTCPACGTKQKLFRRRHRMHSRVR